MWIGPWANFPQYMDPTLQHTAFFSAWTAMWHGISEYSTKFSVYNLLDMPDEPWRDKRDNHKPRNTYCKCFPI